MGRPKKVKYWNQVTVHGKNSWKCNHCGREFKGGASRIKAHVKGKKGGGIEACKGSINCDPQEAVNAMNPVEGKLTITCMLVSIYYLYNWMGLNSVF